MVRELKQLLQDKITDVYLAIVRRTATQGQTIDVEVITANFDVNTPNTDYYVYKVQISPVVILYGNAVTINRPKESSYVVIKRTDNGKWVTLIAGDIEKYYLNKTNKVLDTNGQDYIIQNVDSLSVNKMGLGNKDSDKDMFTLKEKGILFKIADNNANYDTMFLNSNSIGVNSVLRTIEISQKKRNTNSDLQKIQRRIQNAKETSLNNTVTFELKESLKNSDKAGFLLLIPYLFWYAKNVSKSNIVISQKHYDNYKKVATKGEIENIYNKWFFAKSLYSFFLAYYDKRTADNIYNLLVGGYVNLGIFADTFGNKICNQVVKDMGSVILNGFGTTNINFLFPTEPTFKAINDLFFSDKTSVLTSDISSHMVLVTRKLFPFQLKIFKRKFIPLSTYSDVSIRTWNDIHKLYSAELSAFLDVENDIIMLARNSNFQENLGNIMKDMINIMNDRTITVVLSNGSVSPPINLFSTTYDKVKLSNQNLLKIK